MPSTNTSEQTRTKLSDKYGLLLTTEQVAEIFHRTTQSLRSDLSGSDHSEFGKALIKARKYIGRRVYFKAEDIERLIEAL